MKQFNIPAGQRHPRGIHLGLLHSPQESYQFRFDSSCLYLPQTWEHDWGKLAGWSYGILPQQVSVDQNGKPAPEHWVAAHHIDSVRIGWRPYVDPKQLAEARKHYHGFKLQKPAPTVWFAAMAKVGIKPTEIELSLYLYEDGVRRIVELGRVSVDTIHELILAVHPEAAVIALDNIITTRGVRLPTFTRGYLLYPMHGGEQKALHEERISLSRTGDSHKIELSW